MNICCFWIQLNKASFVWLSRKIVLSRGLVRLQCILISRCLIFVLHLIFASDICIWYLHLIYGSQTTIYFDCCYLHLFVASSDERSCCVWSIVSFLCWKYQMRPSRQLSHIVTVSRVRFTPLLLKKMTTYFNFQMSDICISLLLLLINVPIVHGVLCPFFAENTR